MSENQGNHTPMSVSKLAFALAKAQLDIKTPVKNQTVTMKFKDKNEVWREKTYAYADLAGVIDAIREPLSKNEIAYFHKMGYCEGLYGMRTYLIHSSGEFVDTWYPLPDPQKQSIKAQDFGGALTYARRYSLSALVGIASEDDDDGENAPPTEKPQSNATAQNKTQGNQNKAPANNKPKDEPKKTEQKPATAADYIMPEWGGSSKGKALRDVETPILEKLKEHLAGRMKEKPKPANIGEIATAYAHIKAVIVDRSPPPPDDIPENVNPKTGEFHPEDEAQPFPPDETEPAGPTIDDFMIPKGVLEALDPIAGIPLKQISEKELRAAQKILDDEMKKGPKGKITAAAGFELRNKITEFFNSMGG